MERPKDSHNAPISLSSPKVKTVSGPEITEIKRYLLPLLHEFSLQRKVVLHPRDIGILLRKRATTAERNAIVPLRRLLSSSRDWAKESEHEEGARSRGTIL